MNGLTVLNNREWAMLIWLVIFVAWASSKKQSRNSFRSVLKALLVKPIIISLVLMTCYVCMMVFSLSHLGLWNISQLKNTLLWSITIGIVTMFNINRIEQEEHFFRKAALENLKISVLIEYLITLYVFSLPIELVLFPVISLLGMMLAITRTDQQYKPVEKLLTGLLSILGIGLLAFAIYSILINFGDFATASTFVDFFLPIVLSILFLPFIYIELIYVKYENVFVRLQFFIKDPALRKYARWQIARQCSLDLKLLDRFFKNLIRERPNSQQEVVDLLHRSKSTVAGTISNQQS